MSKSYLVRDGDKLHMIGRGKPRLPEGAIDEGIAAIKLAVPPEEVAGEVMMLRTNLEMNCRTVQVGDRLYFHSGDVDALADAKRQGKHRQRRRSSSPVPARRQRGERLHFADPSPSPQPRKAQGVTVAEAAEQAGLTEDEMTTRLVGRARLKVVDGQMVVSVADLNKLAAEGIIPKPSEQAKTTAMLEQMQGKPRNGAADRRTTAVAESIGVELESPSRADDGDQGHASNRAVPGVAVARAEDREPYRLGAPKRWGER